MRSIRETFFSPGRKAFVSQSSITEKIDSLRRALLGEARVIPAPRINGVSGRDLLLKFSNGEVKRGDVLEITTAYRPADEDGKGTRLLYLGPDRFGFGGPDVKHHFHPERPYQGMPNNMIEGLITSWKKVGHITPADWSRMMEETFGPRNPQKAS